MKKSTNEQQNQKLSCLSLAELNSKRKASLSSVPNLTRNMRRRLQIFLNRHNSSNKKRQTSTNSETNQQQELCSTKSPTKTTTNTTKTTIKTGSTSHVPIGTKFNFKQNFLFKRESRTAITTKTKLLSKETDQHLNVKFHTNYLKQLTSKNNCNQISNYHANRTIQKIYSFSSSNQILKAKNFV